MARPRTRLTSKRLTASSAAKQTRVIGAQTYVTDYAYDMADNLTQVTYPSGRLVNYQRDGLGRVAHVTTQQTGASPVQIVASNFAYQPFGPITALHFGNGQVATLTYDSDYRLTDIVTTKGSSAVQDLAYGHDAADNITTIGDALDAARNQTFDYDELHRLVILLDGHDLRDYDLLQLRSHIGVIFQDFVRFHFTAGENIAMGRIVAADDQQRVRIAAERSLADQVVARLPKGFDQPLGKRFNEGVELSGGEWQKIAIARAYMRDADVLILDEPTAALDARSEYEVFKRFRDLSSGKTAIIISHRFSTVRMADRILVLGSGRVVEVGSHEDLVAAGGHYAELFELQAAGYR